MTSAFSWQNSISLCPASFRIPRPCDVVVDVTGDRSKVQCCKEQYYIGTWNVRSMNQGKSEVVRQEMARVNVSILGISKLKWTGMGEFNSDDHYIYYCGKNPSEEMEWPSRSTKESKMQYLDAISKTTE